MRLLHEIDPGRHAADRFTLAQRLDLSSRNNKTPPARTSSTLALAASRGERRTAALAALRIPALHSRDGRARNVTRLASSSSSSSSSSSIIARMPVGDRPRQPPAAAPAARCARRPPLTLKMAPAAPMHPRPPRQSARSHPPISRANSVHSTASATPRPNADSPEKFFYASDAMTMRPQSPVSAPLKPAAFVYANGTPDASIAAASSSLARRPASPIKAVSSPTVHTLHTTPTCPNSSSTPASPTARARLPTDAPPQAVNKAQHARTRSVPPEPLVAVSFSASPTTSHTMSSPPPTPALSRPAMAMASMLQAAAELTEHDQDDDGDSLPQVQSLAGFSLVAASASELVASARRERKVQDLEITNASLEAINRTLERQLRKQTLELRRYRRLSRSGRLSLASAPSSRLPSTALTDLPVHLSDLSEDEASGDDDDDDLDSLDDSDLSSNDSASGGSPGASRRKRDQRRLQLDLSKHQELLVDSQKMNQSLKRCLDWTQVLINEGQKALAYRVRLSQVQFGGRVLAPPDEDDEDNASSPMDDTAIKSQTPELAPPWAEEPRDRDGGIELPVDGG